MFSHISVSNTINKLFNNNNILYLGKKNLFYNTLQQNRNYNIITNTEQSFVGIIHDDPIGFSQQCNELCLHYHTNALIVFHNEPPKVLKKEDKHILATKLKDTIKVFFSDTIRQSWALSNDHNSYSIAYGCSINNQHNPTKEIAVLNLNNNNGINNLYKHIHTIFPNSDLLTSLSDMPDISQYRLVISLENIYDALYSAANGCSVLSNTNTHNALPSIHKIKDLNDVDQQISQVLSESNHDISITQKFIADHLSLEKHYESLNNIFSLLKNRAYLYEA